MPMLTTSEVSVFCAQGFLRDQLDPVAILKIEDLMHELAGNYAIIIVTHNMQQAARASDCTAIFIMGGDRPGMMLEYGPTKQIFTRPRGKRTEDYASGRFG